MRRRAFLSLGAAAVVAPALPALPAPVPLTAATLDAAVMGFDAAAGADFTGYVMYRSALGFMITREEISDNLYAGLFESLENKIQWSMLQDPDTWTPQEYDDAEIE